MATPAMTLNIELPDGTFPNRFTTGRTRLVTSTTHDHIPAATANGVTVTTTWIPGTYDSVTGILTFSQLYPNSGSSNDVIDDPSGTVYELEIELPNHHTDVLHFEVPDLAGTHDIHDYLTTLPEDMPRFLTIVDAKADTDAGNITDTVWRSALGLGNSATKNTGTSSGTVAAGDDSRITGAEQTTNKNVVSGYTGLSTSGAVVAPRVQPPGSNQYANRAWSVAVDNRATTPARHLILTHSFGDYYFDSGSGELPENLCYAAVYEREAAKQLGTTYARGRGLLVGSYPAESFYPVGAQCDNTTGAANTSYGLWGHSVDLGNNEYLEVLSAACDGVIVGYTAKRTNGGTANVRDHSAGSTVTTITGTDGTIAASPGYDSGRVVTAAFTSYATRTIRVVGSHASNDITIDWIYPTYGNRTSGLQVVKAAKGGQSWTSFLLSTSTQQSIANLAPQKITVMLLHNDAASSPGLGLSASACESVITTGVALLRTLVPNASIEIVFEPRTDILPSTWGTTYRNMVRSFCAANDVQFTDMYEALGEYTTASDPLSLAPTDHIHPEKKAHARMARVLVDSSLTGTIPAPVRALDGFSETPTAAVRFSDGTAAAPAITGSDTDSGLVFAANEVDISAGGTARVTVDSTRVTVTNSLRYTVGSAGLIDLTSVVGSPYIALHNATSDTQPQVLIAPSTITGLIGAPGGGVTFGPGGSTNTSEYLAYSASGVLATGSKLIVADATAATHALNRQTGDARYATLATDFTLADGTDITVNTSTGTKIGTGTTQKLGFFNATPVAQQSSTTDLRTGLINLGFFASGGASPLNLNGGALTAAAGTFSGTLANTSGQLDVTDGTASHGKVRATVSVLGAGLLVYGDSTDTQGKAALLSTSLGFGPGGSSGTDWTLTRSGVGVATIGDGHNLALGTSTGTKVGTATSQKLAFWNKTPIIQPTTGITGATRVGGGGTTVTTTDTFGGYTIAQLAAVIINTGLAA